MTNGASILQDSATASLQPEKPIPPGYLKTAVNFLTRSSARTRSVMSLSSTATPWTSRRQRRNVNFRLEVIVFFDFCPCQRYMQENHRGGFLVRALWWKLSSVMKVLKGLSVSPKRFLRMANINHPAIMSLDCPKQMLKLSSNGKHQLEENQSFLGWAKW